ncbi:hypothetical protein [Bacterioplanoides sp.]|uniref:hypothetical protein n=1 Tax=Bacterioplanoides sp. TaxID=2066072 RepID=UPI003B00FD07
MKIWLLLLCFLFPCVQAAEVDQFTDINHLKDSSAVIEAEVNRRIQLAIDNANSYYPQPLQKKKLHHRRRPQCDVERLYGQLRSQLAQPLIGQLEIFAEESPQVDKRRVGFEDSVYRDFERVDAPSLVISERVAAVIRINYVYLGSDKLGHFFTEGNTYFEITDRMSGGIEAGLLYGEWSESLYFGAQTTGVYSYADLVANFNGMRFWNRILAHYADPLTQQFQSPYIVCDHQRWVKKTPFNFDDYVDYGWDESINCSALRTQTLLQQFEQHQPRCDGGKVPRRYGNYSRRMINRDDFKVLPYDLQPEIIAARRAYVHEWNLPVWVTETIHEVRLELEAWRDQ